MRRYTILKINKIVGTTHHIYTAVQHAGEFTGDYVCPTLDNDTKIVTDFICMNNSYITSVRVETGTRLGLGQVFDLNERTTQGIITGFKPNKANMDVLLDGARTNGININTITKRVVATPAATRNVTTNTNPSRSQQPNDPFNALENTIAATRDIRLEKTLKKTIHATVQLFLQDFFERLNGEKATIYVDDKSVQTTVGRRRSLGDIYKLCKYYFPACTLKEVINMLYRTLPDHYTTGFRSSYCNTIYKRVWYYIGGIANKFADTTTNDEYGNVPTYYTSKL